MKRWNSLWGAALFVVFVNSSALPQEEKLDQETGVVISLYNKGVMQYTAPHKEAVDVFHQVLSAWE